MWCSERPAQLCLGGPALIARGARGSSRVASSSAWTDWVPRQVARGWLRSCTYTQQSRTVVLARSRPRLAKSQGTRGLIRWMTAEWMCRNESPAKASAEVASQRKAETLQKPKFSSNFLLCAQLYVVLLLLKRYKQTKQQLLWRHNNFIQDSYSGLVRDMKESVLIFGFSGFESLH